MTISISDSKTSLNIDLAAMGYNYQFLAQKLAPHASAGAAIKADAYGLGAKYVAPYLNRQGVKEFFTAYLHEALEIAPLIGDDAKIYTLNGLDIHHMELYDDNRIIPVINSLSELEQLHRYLRVNNRTLTIALHVDTGINRLGFPSDEWQRLLDDDQWLSVIKPCLIMTHFACAEELDNPYTKQQKEQFYQLIQPLAQKVRFRTSLANTAGIFRTSDYHGDLVRPGIGLYGGGHKELKPVVHLSSPIIQIKTIFKGESVGYNQTWRASEQSQIATIPLGYGDGFLRYGSNQAYGWIQGIKVPIVGRVSMDLITLDVSAVPKNYQCIGQPVEILGDHISISDLAERCGTIAYEILTSLGQRYQRIIKD